MINGKTYIDGQYEVETENNVVSKYHVLYRVLKITRLGAPNPFTDVYVTHYILTLEQW